MAVAQPRLQQYPTLIKKDQNLHATTHICSTAHWRFDLSATIRTLGYSDGLSIIGGNVVVYQFSTALRAFHACHTHTTLITNVLNHDRSPFAPALGRYNQPVTSVRMTLDYRTRQTD